MLTQHALVGAYDSYVPNPLLLQLGHGYQSVELQKTGVLKAECFQSLGLEVCCMYAHAHVEVRFRLPALGGEVLENLQHLSCNIHIPCHQDKVVLKLAILNVPESAQHALLLPTQWPVALAPMQAQSVRLRLSTWCQPAEQKAGVQWLQVCAQQLTICCRRRIKVEDLTHAAQHMRQHQHLLTPAIRNLIDAAAEWVV